MWPFKPTLKKASHPQGIYYVYMLRVRQPNDHNYNPTFIPTGIFYVGKGTKDRMYAHVKETRAKLRRGDLSKLSYKNKVILNCIDNAIPIDYEVVYRNDDEEACYDVESQLISHFSLQRLTNEAYGRRITKKRVSL